MPDYDSTTYGERIAEVYDSLYPDIDARLVPVLAELAGAGGRALELGIGTGRIALPLARAGVHIEGLDASPAMVAQMRAKPGGDAIPVTMGDFETVPVDGEFSLVLVVFNTFFQLLTQDAQVHCFEAVSRRLAPGGAFLIEAFVPDLTRYSSGGSHVSAVQVGTNAVDLDAARHDANAQRVTVSHVHLTEAGARLYPVELRYAWPSELDLMARLAGLELRDRWAGWGRDPFTSEATRHVSVYARP